MMPDEALACYPIQDLVAELKRRDISFVFAFVDHQQFTKSESMAQEVVWAIDSGGNLIFQDTLIRFLNRWHEQVVRQRTAPGSGAKVEEDD